MRVTTGRFGAAMSALAAIGCAAAVSGCGSSTVQNIVDPVAKAATVSNAAAGYQMSFTMAISSPAIPTPINATGSGSFEPASRTGSLQMSMDLGSSLQSVLGSSTLSMQELVNGTTYYIKLPSSLTSKLPGGKPWLSVDLAALGNQAGIPGLSSLFSNPTSSNPAAMLQYLKSASGNVTKVGTATINGQQTTEYHATLDLAKYPSLVPASERASAQQAISALEKASGLKSFPLTVWIDNRNLVRRMQFAVSSAVPSTGQSVKTTMTLNITSYGAQPAPSFPPASEVSPLSSLLGG